METRTRDESRETRIRDERTRREQRDERSPESEREKENRARGSRRVQNEKNEPAF